MALRTHYQKSMRSECFLPKLKGICASPFQREAVYLWRGRGRRSEEQLTGSGLRPGCEAQLWSQTLTPLCWSAKAKQAQKHFDIQKNSSETLRNSNQTCPSKIKTEPTLTFKSLSPQPSKPEESPEHLLISRPFHMRKRNISKVSKTVKGLKR